MDKLDYIFNMQKFLMKKYGFKGPINIDTKKGQNKIREVMFFMVHEVFEASEWMKMKPWRKTIVKTDIKAFLEEIVDVLHFYVELCIYLGIDSNKLTGMYKEKAYKNLERLKNRY